MEAACSHSRDEVVQIARSWLGTPYRNRAALKGVGADCVGLVRGVYSEIYGVTPEIPAFYSSGWQDLDKTETLLVAAEDYLEILSTLVASPGDVIIFRMHPKMAAKHCGIVTYEGRMVHALSGHRVEEVTMGLTYWPKAVRAFKFPGVC